MGDGFIFYIFIAAIYIVFSIVGSYTKKQKPKAKDAESLKQAFSIDKEVARNKVRQLTAGYEEAVEAFTQAIEGRKPDFPVLHQAEDVKEGTAVAAHKHRYTQNSRDVLGSRLPDSVNESVAGQEGEWGDEGHSEHYTSAFFTDEFPTVTETEQAEWAELELESQAVMQGVIWSVVLARPVSKCRRRPLDR
jgi:hypothetical protein